MTPPRQVLPRRWTDEQLKAGRDKAIEAFRSERMEEPLEDYSEAFEEYQETIEELLETTVDLASLDDNALAILSDPKLLDALRYLAGPPISKDDLRVLSDVKSLTPKRLRKQPELAKQVIETVRLGLDHRRFPWVVESREPTEQERNAAAIASAALMAAARVATKRRNESKTAQELAVCEALKARGLQQVPARPMTTLGDAPAPGEFCQESMVGERKADIVVRLWDGRMMAIECKVSNSEVNSIKRLKNDAASKAEVWVADFGERHVVPAAVLSGVYNLRHLVEAQNRGLTIFWAHDLSELVNWIEGTRQAGR